MKVSHAVQLDQWIKDRKEKLSGPGRGILKDIAKEASDFLGFKVATGNLATLMRDNGIETKRVSQRDAERLAMLSEIEKLTAENMSLKRTLAKVVASDHIPADLKDYVLAGLPQEIQDALKTA